VTVPVIDAVRVVLGPDEQAAAAAVLASGRLTQGEQVAAFEHEFADAFGAHHAVAVNSGTSALHVALLAAGIGPGDEVVVPSFTFAATANAVALTGAEPVFADVDASTFCLDPDSAAAAIGPRTAGIVPVHLFGQMAPMEELTRLADRHGLFLLEDAAQAHAARSPRGHAGTVGGAGAFSFYATKNLTTGEGGLITFKDAGLARRARMLRNQGMEKRYANELVGLNNRMTDVAAAIGRVQLRRLAELNTRRRTVADAYRDGLEALAGLGTLQLPVVAAGNQHVYHQFTLRVEGRDGLQERLTRHGVQTNVYYPTPVHRLPAYDVALDLPMTGVACAEVLSLPMHPHLTDDEVDRVVNAVHEEVSR
jgi:perosamine synthetase